MVRASRARAGWSAPGPIRHNGWSVTPISTTAVVVASRDGQLSTSLAGEVVILDVERGVYFGLDGIGAKVWELLQAPRPVADIVDRLAPQYDVALATLTTDVLELLADLAGRGLIDVDPPAGA